MRFLHTADWHLGRSLHGESLLSAQAMMLEHLADVAREARVDAILLAGDVYDRALPPVDAIRLADDGLARLRAVCPTIVISGNHDSAVRLGHLAPLLADVGLHIRTDPAQVATPIVIGDTCIYAIPYLEPDLARTTLAAPARTHMAVLTAAMARIHADLAARPAQTRSIVVAHAFVAGGAESASERSLVAGGSPSVPAATFAGVDYLALGHLHAPQAIGTGRYAGSPLALSFSEAGHKKSSVILDLTAAEPQIELVSVPVQRPLSTLRGTLERLLSEPDLATHEDHWLEVTLTDVVRPRDAMARLRARFPHVLRIEFAPEGNAESDRRSYLERTRGLSDEQLAAQFIRDVRGSDPDAAERELLDRALAAVRAAEAAA